MTTDADHGIRMPRTRRPQWRGTVRVLAVALAIGTGGVACSAGGSSAAAPASSTSASATATATTAATSPAAASSGAAQSSAAQPVARSVEVRKGRAAAGQPGCSVDACAHVGVTLKGFASPARCSVALDGKDFHTETLAADFTGDTTAYVGFPGRTVTVTCDGVTGSLVW